MSELPNYTGVGWRRPGQVNKVIKKAKTKKKALDDRLFPTTPPSSSSSNVSPSGRPVRKRNGGCRQSTAKRRCFGAEPPPPEDVTNEDSTLMDLMSLKGISSASASSSLSPGSSMSPGGPAHHFWAGGGLTKPATVSISPLRSYLMPQLATTPSPLKRRQVLVRAPALPSPTWATHSVEPQIDVGKAKRRLSMSFDSPTTESDQRTQLCVDWSLKSRLVVMSRRPYTWRSASLKLSEESSGVTAFVRCVDMDPSVEVPRGLLTPSSNSGAELDTSLGAQFHQCCLYWQHPTLPTHTLFPREDESDNKPSMRSSPATAAVQTETGDRLDPKVLAYICAQWKEALQSAFHLLRTRQCPFFYLHFEKMTVLFSAAGTRGHDEVQVFVTPARRHLREALLKEGIAFVTPCDMEEDDSTGGSPPGEKETEPTPPPSEPTPPLPISEEPDAEPKTPGSEGEPDEWLHDLGVTKQKLKVAQLHETLNKSPDKMSKEKKRASLLLITGANTTSFVKFVIATLSENKGTAFVLPFGNWAGIPPTILSPVAFHGATLNSLKVGEEEKAGVHSIVMEGPVLPHVMHMLVRLLQKSVRQFRVGVTTVSATGNLNITAGGLREDSRACAFHLQSLSDCGLRKSIIDLLCRDDNYTTIRNNLEYRRKKFHWT